MTIARKLYALAAIAIFGVVLLAGVGTYQIQRVNTTASYSTENTVPSILELDRVIDAVYFMRVATWEYISSPDRASRRETEKNISASLARIAKALDTYEKEDISDATDAEMLKEVRKHVATYEAALTTVMTQAQTDPVGARRAMLADQAIVEALMSALEEQKRYNEKLGKAAAKTAATTKNQAIVVALVISVITAAVVGLILYFLLARSAVHSGKP
ncbi:MAG: MCP four helix bundle domain-containing protein [Herbaspirillum sp.]|nr:MCP four helix bundle domain-containing protein [Herbaspirillum sp.]